MRRWITRFLFYRGCSCITIFFLTNPSLFSSLSSSVSNLSLLSFLKPRLNDDLSCIIELEDTCRIGGNYPRLTGTVGIVSLSAPYSDCRFIFTFRVLSGSLDLET